MRFPIHRVDKPWGYELLFAHMDRYVGKILHVDAGQRVEEVVRLEDRYGRV